MDDKQFDPEEIVKQPVLASKPTEQNLDDGMRELSEEEWEEVTKLQGKNRPDGTVISREEAIAEVKGKRK